MLSKMAFLDHGSTVLFTHRLYLTPYSVFVIVLGFALSFIPFDKFGIRDRVLAGNHTGLAAFVGIFLLLFGIGELAAAGFNPFIYFQF